MGRCAALIVIALGLVAGAYAHAQSADSAKAHGSLRRYTLCHYNGGLTALSVERAPNLPMARPVETSGGRKPVSVADGYRLILAFPDRDPFVNLKIERSDANHYVLDKQAVLEQMQFMAAGAKGAAIELQRSQRQGIDVAALNNPTLDGPTISFYSLFNDQTKTIVTAYILNQLPERRSFQDLKEYRSQRDRFVADLVSCLTPSTFR